MVEHICEKCNKIFTKKSTFNDHVKRKNTCITLLDDTHNIHINPPNNVEYENNTPVCKKKYTCHSCNSSFSRSDSLLRHTKNNCKSKKEQSDENEHIIKLLDEKDKKIDLLIEQNQEIIKKKDDDYKKIIEKKDKDIYKLISQIQKLVEQKTNKSVNNTNNGSINSNNTKTINNTVNIQIAQFGKEEFDIIDDKHFQKILKDPRILGLKVPEEILKLIHFNPDYPQFILSFCIFFKKI
jgi:succinate dehydrogenase flavin-adding protein (antitoxin of CptAB toxin-antitoxin module)